MKQQYAPDLGKLRLEREEIDRKRDEYIKKLSAAREKLSWDNFTSVPPEKEADLKKTLRHLELQKLVMEDALETPVTELLSDEEITEKRSREGSVCVRTTPIQCHIESGSA